MRQTASWLAAAAALAPGLLPAYPDGAPWGAADPAAAESCGACHYDYEPVQDSAALAIEGLPATARPGETYALRLCFGAVGAAVAGFQLLATAAHGAGTLSSADPAIESIGAASRSTLPVDAAAGACWSVSWRAPDADGTEVALHLAASAANDDQSPLGDTIHYRAFRVAVARPEDATIDASAPDTKKGDPL